MKKFGLLLAAVGLSLLLCGSAMGYQVYWDLGGAGITGLGAPLGDADNLTGLFDEITFYSETTVTQYDNDGTPGVTAGDTFGDNGAIVATSLVPTNIDTEGINLAYEMTGALQNAAGVVTAVTYDLGTGDTRIDYAYTSGSISLWVDQPRNANFQSRGDTDDVGFTDGFKIADFTLDFGIGHTFIDLAGGDVDNQGSGEFQLHATWLADNFWFNADGDDIHDIYDDVTKPISWFLSTTDYNVDKPELTFGGQNDQFFFKADVTHDGSMEFNAVPEPGTMLLLGVGLLGIAGLGRKRILKQG